MSFPTTPPITGQTTTSVTHQQRPLVLHEGQMFHGQIKQLFPGQMAEVQIGGQKLMANLEVPMKAGDSYYFQVSAVKPELQLKIIAGPLQAADGQGRQLGALMDAMQLPKTLEMQSILAFAMKNKIPMTREGLLQAENLLNNAPAGFRNEALASIQRLVELKLPFTESTFRSLLGVESKDGMHAVLTSLKAALKADSAITPQMKEGLQATLDNMAKPFAQSTGGVLLSQSLLTLLDQTESPKTRFAILQLLKGTDILPARASLANLQQVLSEVVTRKVPVFGGDGPLLERQVAQQNQPTSILKPHVQPIMAAGSKMGQMITALGQIDQGVPSQSDASFANLKALLSDEPGMSSQQKAILQMIIDRAAITGDRGQPLTKFVQEFSQSLVKVVAENALSIPFKQPSTAEGAIDKLLLLLGQQTSQQGTEKMISLIQAAERSENASIQRIVQMANATVASAIDGKAMKDAMQTVIRSLGFNYEAELIGKDLTNVKIAEILKPQLVRLLQDPTISSVLREAAETAVMRLNGPLLQSGENGVQHQLVMQVPLEIFGKRIDSTLQWNGRMKENGKIDSDFARILFYLDLASMKQTIIDMQVQNRVVTITVYNGDDSLKGVGLPLQKKLKEGLESVGYQLSGLSFKPFVEEKNPLLEQKKQRSSDGELQGVDFRI